GAVDLSPLEAAHDRLRSIEEALAGLGGDTRSRARELDLLAFQVGELDAAGLGDPGEDEVLAREEEDLAGATANREATASALTALSSDVADGGATVGGGRPAGAIEAVGEAVGAVAGRAPLAEIESRLRAVEAELVDAASGLRRAQ